MCTAVEQFCTYFTLTTSIQYNSGTELNKKKGGGGMIWKQCALMLVSPNKDSIGDNDTIEIYDRFKFMSRNFL